LFFVQSNTCFLFNKGAQAITEFDFDLSSVAFEDGFVVGDDYGRFRVRDFMPGTFFKLYELTVEDMMLLPQPRWFQLNIHLCSLADGSKITEPIMKSVDKYGGYKPDGEFVTLPIETVTSP